MSSSLDGVATVAGGVVGVSAAAVAGGVVVAGAAAVGAVFGTGWMLYQSGRLVADAVTAVNQAVDDLVDRKEMERFRRRETALKARADLITTFETFTKESEAMIGEVTDPAVAAEMRQVLAQLQHPACGQEEAADLLEAQNIQMLSAMEMAAHQLKEIRNRRRIKTATMSDTELDKYIGEFSKTLAAVQVRKQEIADAEKLNVLSPAEIERRKLEAARDEAIVAARTAALHEAKRLKETALTQKEHLRIIHVFEGLEELLETLTAPDVSDETLRLGIAAIHDWLVRYRLFRESIDAAAAEFNALYPVYVKVRTEMNMTIRKPEEFTDLEDMRAEMRYCEQLVDRAAKLSEQFIALGEEGYIVGAFIHELQKLGYSVEQAETMLAQFRRVAGERRKERVVQTYRIDENCSLELVINPDGSTSLLTRVSPDVSGETAEASVSAHCARASRLVQNLWENWLIVCHLEDPETGAAQPDMEAARARRVQGDQRRVRAIDPITGRIIIQ